MATIFALGSNGSGQLGIGHKEDVSVPKPVLFSSETNPPTSIAAVAAGGNHTLFLSGQGDLFWAGDPKSGCCGSVTAQTEEPCFQKMDLPTTLGTGETLGPVTLVAATWDATIFVRADARGKNTHLFTCGMGEKGELGQGPLIVRTPKPERIADFPPPGTEIVALAACMGHAVLVLDSGDAYGWGNGRKGQLGVPAEVVFSPRKIEAPPGEQVYQPTRSDGIRFAVKKAVCGKEFTCLYGDSVVGHMSILGSDKWDVKKVTPDPVIVPGLADIFATWNSLHLLWPSGILSSYGRNDLSQRAPLDLGPVTQIATGSEHTVALLKDGDVHAWGWGEHGNCGPGDGDKGQHNVIASSKFIPDSAKITLVGAGCATSWVVIEGLSQ